MPYRNYLINLLLSVHSLSFIPSFMTFEHYHYTQSPAEHFPLPLPSIHSYVPPMQTDLLPYPVPDGSAAIPSSRYPTFHSLSFQPPANADPVSPSATYSDTSLFYAPLKMSFATSHISQLLHYPRSKQDLGTDNPHYDTIPLSSMIPLSVNNSLFSPLRSN